MISPLVRSTVRSGNFRTFPAGAVRERTRTLTRGDRCDPLDLVEWLEEQGYEPEAQVTQKGEIALRGGILDVYPLTSPWPVRLEFFGDELESLRQFDPLTQISREEIAAVTIPPAGELGLLKQSRNSAESEVLNEPSQPSTLNPQPLLGTLLDYLPAESVLVLCEPEQLAERADEYAQQVPEGDPFFVPWEAFQQQAAERGMTLLEIREDEPGETCRALPESFPLPKGEGQGERESDADNPATNELSRTADISHSPLRTPHFASLEAFRPLPERAPDRSRKALALLRSPAACRTRP